MQHVDIPFFCFHFIKISATHKLAVLSHLHMVVGDQQAYNTEEYTRNLPESAPTAFSNFHSHSS